MGQRGPLPKLAGGTDSAAFGTVSSIPSMPRGLDDEAKRFWREVVPKLGARGVLRDVDGAMLQSMAEWWGELCRMKTAMREAVPGTREHTFLASVTQGCQKRFDFLAGRFGLSPIDRCRLPKEKAAAPKLERRIR
jgi:phage terminase small subunit